MTAKDEQILREVEQEIGEVRATLERLGVEIEDPGPPPMLPPRAEVFAISDLDCEDGRTVLTSDLDETRKIYAAKSSDKNAMKRSWKFCIQRLLKRFPEHFQLSEDAQSRLGSSTTEGFDKLYEEA